MIVNQVGNNQILSDSHNEVPQISPNHTIDHLNFEKILGWNATRPPDMLTPYGH